MPEKERYAPPAIAWRLPLFIEATSEELSERLVDCSRCPVFIQCEAGEGGTGWVCQRCESTGVAVVEIQESKVPDDLLAIDCASHKFNRLPVSDNMVLCSLCSGGQMELELNFPESRFHLVTTVHAKVPVEERQKFLREKMEFWKAAYTKSPTP